MFDFQKMYAWGWCFVAWPRRLQLCFLSESTLSFMLEAVNIGTSCFSEKQATAGYFVMQLQV